MNVRQQSRLTNFNRLLIFTLSLGGLMTDGLQIDDLPCLLALYIWLWLPFCTRLEASLLRWIDGVRSSENPSPHHQLRGDGHYRS